jgi:hypothetical protein
MSVVVHPERRVVPAGASPVRASAGAPASRLQASGEIRVGRAECQMPLKRRGADQRAATTSERSSHGILSAERCLRGPSRSCRGEGNRQHSGPERRLNLFGFSGGGTLGKSSAEHAEGGLETREGGVRFLGRCDSQEAEHLAFAGQALYATVAVSEGDPESSRPNSRANRCAAEREGWEADYRGTESRAWWLGPFLEDGECRSGVQPAGRVCLPTHAALAGLVRRATGDTPESPHRRSALPDGSASAARHSVLSLASDIPKIIVKPCAGKLQARFERGLKETGWR